MHAPHGMDSAGLTVGDVVEHVRFIDSTAPDANHILIPVHEELQPLSVLVGGQPYTTQNNSQLGKKRSNQLRYLVRKESAGIQFEPARGRS